MKAPLLSLLWAGAAIAQPFVYYRGAVNAGSFLPPGLPNAAIARGSMFSVFGDKLGPAAGQQVSAFPLQPSFAGVSIEISQGSTKVNALPVYVAASQLNAIMPSNAPLGTVSLRVVFNGQTSNPIPLTVTQSSVGLFSVNGGGFGPGIVQNFVSDLNRPINSLATTARPGQVEILWGTGLGPASFSDAIAPPAVTIEPTTEVFVGGKKAVVTYAGRSPCCSSIDQIVFTVPADAPAGCYVPVVVRTLGAMVSNTVTMAIHPSGAACSDANNPLNSQRAGGKTALAQLSRESILVDFEGPAYEAVLDTLTAVFRGNPASDYFFSALSAPPPVGSCTVYAGPAESRAVSPLSPPGSQVSPGSPLKVDVGTASISVPASTDAPGTFVALLGGQSQLPSLAPPVLTGGPFVLSGPGSPAAPPFRASLDNVAALTWTNRALISTVDRTQDLTLTWTALPGTSRGAIIAGGSRRLASNAVSVFVCSAGSATSFTIPAYVLASLPASASDGARISIGSVPLTSAAALPGFDSSFIGFSSWTSRSLVVK